MSMRADNHCDGCGADLRGDPIPEEIREHYGNKTHSSRVIGVEYMGGYDGVSEFQCPDCGRREGRWSGRVLGDGEVESRPRYDRDFPEEAAA